MTRTGKIARLPHAIREQLNRRLQDGEQGKTVLSWLNSLPEVQAVLAADFTGQPINPQNLSEWRRGGYRDWLDQQEAKALIPILIEEAKELQTAPDTSLTDQMAVWAFARLMVTTRKLSAHQPNEAARWKLLREASAMVVEFRKGDHSAERLRIEREWLDREKQETAKEKLQQFWKWANDPEIREKICRGFKTQAEKIALLRKILFGDLDELEGTGEVEKMLEILTPSESPTEPSATEDPDAEKEQKIREVFGLSNETDCPCSRQAEPDPIKPDQTKSNP